MAGIIFLERSRSPKINRLLQAIKRGNVKRISNIKKCHFLMEHVICFRHHFVMRYLSLAFESLNKLALQHSNTNRLSHDAH